MGPMTMTDPGFPRGWGANSRGGAPTYDFAKFSQKLHEIERIWTRGEDVPRFTPWIRYCTEELLPRIITACNSSCGKECFYIRVSRILSTGGGGGRCIPVFLWADTPIGRHPPHWQTPPPPDRHPTQHYEIRSTSGRYASYWNAFL